MWRNFAPVSAQRRSQKTAVLNYKNHLHATGRAVVGINATLAAINSYLDFLRRSDLKVKYDKVQRVQFRQSNRELTRAEYARLLTAALDTGNRRLWLILQTICSTGIRVSELQFLTTDAVNIGQMTVTNKAKTRVVPLTEKLCAKLKTYVKKMRIVGVLFGVNRHQIWREMKRLCARANVSPGKVFPHNLRHLFAVSFYKKNRDVVKLAALLGHADVNTTRVYTLESDIAYRVGLDLGLVS